MKFQNLMCFKSMNPDLKIMISGFGFGLDGYKILLSEFGLGYFRYFIFEADLERILYRIQIQDNKSDA